MLNDDDLDDFYEDYENDNKNYKLLISFEPGALEYTSKDIDMSKWSPKFKKKLTASIFVKKNPNKGSLF